MGDLICIEAHARDWVRCCRDPWDCDWWGRPTRGRVYEETQTVVCSACRKPLLEIDSDPRHYIAFEEDID